jgi:hypothetical protein
MKPSVLPTLGLWLALFGAVAAMGEDTVRAGAHYRVICHFKSDEIAAAALETAESAWPLAEELFGVKEAAPATPLEIHLYRSAADYEQAEAKITEGRFRANLAFAEPKTKSAHVALQPDRGDEALAALGLNAQTRRLIAHEAAHLFRYATMPNARSHPDWLADGAAGWIDDEAMTRGGFSPGSETDPYAATCMLAVQRLVQQGKPPTLDALLRDRIEDLPPNARYGLRWLLFRFMETEPRRDAWKKILLEARRLGGGKEYAEKLRTATADILGADHLPILDQEFQKYLASLKPQWEEVYRTLDTRGNVWTQMAFSDANAIAWRTEPVGKDEYGVGGALRILPGGKKQLNLLLGRDDAGFISVAFVAGDGVTLFDYHADRKDGWERLGGAEIAELALDHWTPFRVDIRRGNIEITLNERVVLTAPLRGRTMSGAWGLGAQVGSTGQWRDIKADK